MKVNNFTKTYDFKAPDIGKFNLSDGINAPIELLFLPFIDTLQTLLSDDAPPIPLSLKATITKQTLPQQTQHETTKTLEDKSEIKPGEKAEEKDEVELKFTPNGFGTLIEGHYGPLKVEEKVEEELDETGNFIKKIYGSIGSPTPNVELQKFVDWVWFITKGMVASMPVRHALTLNPNGTSLDVTATLGGVPLSQSYYPQYDRWLMTEKFGNTKGEGITFFNPIKGKWFFEHRIGNLKMKGEIGPSDPLSPDKLLLPNKLLEKLKMGKYPVKIANGCLT